MARKKLNKAEQAQPEPHPEDREARIKGTEAGQKVIGAFVEANAQRLAELISTWGDGDAHDELSALREEFWGPDGPVAAELYPKK